LVEKLLSVFNCAVVPHAIIFIIKSYKKYKLNENYKQNKVKYTKSKIVFLNHILSIYDIKNRTSLEKHG